ncbi:MAG: hypothetical protein KKI09_07135 [Spirochaetes bacterium]|nr:hypothetical protein [Spirochaetota bacterium]
MLQLIESLIKAGGRASEYRIAERTKNGLEWYFVRDRLDSSRAVVTTRYEVTVYVDSINPAADNPASARTRGECSVLIQPGSTEAEIRTILDRALDTAAGMKNAWFPLPEPAVSQNAVATSRFDSLSLPQAMEAVRSALYKHDGLDGSTINSLEIFLSQQHIHLLTSRGVDVSWKSWNGFCEYIVNAGTRGKDEVELYADLHFADLDEAPLSEAVRIRLQAASDRLAAVPTPELKGLPLLLSGHLAADLYEYWFQNAQAMAVYEKRAAFAVGDDVSAGQGSQKQGSTSPLGDPINLRAIPTLAGSPLGAPYDQTGFALKPVELIRDNKVLAVVASSKYAHYLQLPATGAIPLFEVAGGHDEAATLRAVDHLEVLAFSDFFVDSTTGDFGGEIRLAYLLKGGKRQPVYGGAVTGNLVDNRGLIRLSRELETSAKARGPVSCLLPIVSITPAG